MNKLFVLIEILILSSLIFSKYVSSYYKNTTNILDKYPKIDIDYIFFQPNQNEQKDTSNNNQNNIKTNIFQNIFYDYYQTSVPLYDERMKCYFPIKKNISLDINTDNNNFTKIKNISSFYGKKFIKSLKGKCEKFYIDRWYYTLCPLVGAMQTLSYIKSNDNNKKEEEKQEVNYLGYELSNEISEKEFLKHLYGDFLKFAEKKYYNEIMDIKEENLFNMYGEKNKIIGIYKNLVRFYGDTAFDSSKYPKVSKNFILEYSYYKRSEKIIFKTNILKVISDNLILLNETIPNSDLIRIKNLTRIKVLNDYSYSNKLDTFFNQSFFIYDEYLYSNKFNLALCLNMDCHVTISNDQNIYKVDLIVDTKLAIIEKSVNPKRDLKLYKDVNYCIFYGTDYLYYFGNGEIHEFTETNDPSTFILYGDDLNIEDSIEIWLLFNDTLVDGVNYYFVNDIFSKNYISVQFLNKINKTHFEVKMLNKKDIIYFEKDKALDGKYIIVKNNSKTKKKTDEVKEEAKYIILGNDKNISIENNINEQPEKEKIKIDIPKEEYKEYKISNNKEFIFNFELSPYNFNSKDSFITICFSNNKKCKPGEDYEMLIDLRNEGVVMQKINDKNNNNSLIYSMIGFKNNNEIKEKANIIFINSTIYYNHIFNLDKNKEDSEIKLKYKIKNETFNINYIIINKNKSRNIIINDINFEDNVSFEYFKKIFFYEQKFLLDNNALYIDTFEKGDYCEPIKAPRRVIIYYSCDEQGLYDLQVDKVFEDKKDICVYHFYAKSKYLCNPNMLMQNYLKSSGLKTSCYLDNN